MENNILKAINELKEKSKKRNFSQTFDLIIILKEMDLKKQENKFSEEVVLPRGRGEDAVIVVFSDTLKNLDCETMGTSDIEKLSKNKREVKKMVSGTQFFLAEAPMMPLVGKALGQFLAPRGKMPKIVTGDAAHLVKNLKRSVHIKIKDAPVIQCLVGSEDMPNEDVAENVEAVLEFLNTKLPKGKHNIGKVLIKLTMSEPVKVM
jgi:large subunit ribosomal protein L1